MGRSILSMYIRRHMHRSSHSNVNILIEFFLMYAVLGGQSTKRLSVSARLENEDDKFWDKATASAETIIKLSRDPPDGLGNFRFCASFSCPPGIPFFPAAYHQVRA